MCLWLNITPIFHTKQLFNNFRITCFRMKEQTWYHILKNKTNSRSHFSHTLFWSHQRFFEKKYNLKICLNEQRIKENFYRTFYVLNNNYWFSTFFINISVNPSGPCFKKNERLGMSIEAALTNVSCDRTTWVISNSLHSLLCFL